MELGGARGKYALAEAIHTIEPRIRVQGLDSSVNGLGMCDIFRTECRGSQYQV